MSSSVEIGRISTTMNSVNGAGVQHEYFNATDKEIKYLTFVYVPYNQVGDQVQCTMSRKSKVSCKITGPIKPYHESDVEWDALWYNPTATKAELVEIHIDYMDGSEEIIAGSDVVNMYDKQSVYYEKIEKPREIERAERKKKEQEQAEKAAIERAENEKKRARNSELKQAYLCFKVFSSLKKTKDDEELKFHANQGLWLFIFEVIAVICGVLDPVIGAGILLILLGICIYFASKCCKSIEEGTRYEIPVISKIKLIK